MLPGNFKFWVTYNFDIDGFAEYFAYTQTLGYSDTPDYDRLIRYFDKGKKRYEAQYCNETDRCYNSVDPELFNTDPLF